MQRARVHKAYTDSHGQFSFQLGADVQMFQDASESVFDPARPGFGGPNAGIPNVGDSMPNPGFSTRDLMGCELQASLPGFRSDSISLAGRQLFDNPDLSTIVLHRMGKVEGTRVSVTTLKAPKDAKKAFERGTHLLKEHKQMEAGKEFAKAVALYPKYAEAMAKLGEIYMDEGRGDDAEKLFQQAIEADARFMPPYFDLVLLAARKQELEADGRPLGISRVCIHPLDDFHCNLPHLVRLGGPVGSRLNFAAYCKGRNYQTNPRTIQFVTLQFREVKPGPHENCLRLEGRVFLETHLAGIAGVECSPGGKLSKATGWPVTAISVPKWLPRYLTIEIRGSPNAGRPPAILFD